MKKRNLCMALGWLAAFLLWTAAVCLVDVRPIGPMGSAVGLGGLNGWFHRLTGVHPALYAATDWLSLVPAAVIPGFGLLGLAQWIRRKDLRRVDADLPVLGGFYVAVLAAYLFFEVAVVNRRPVLIEGVLEASYPSSTTVLVLTVMSTAALQLKHRIPNRAVRRWAVGAVAAFSLCMVLGRLVSGVHWLSDIVGGVLLSGGLVELYRALTE